MTLLAARSLCSMLFGLRAKHGFVWSLLRVSYSSIRWVLEGRKRKGSFAIVLVIWLERYGRIFKNRRLDLSLLCDRVVFLALLWTKAAGAFAGVYIKINITPMSSKRRLPSTRGKGALGVRNLSPVIRSQRACFR